MTGINAEQDGCGTAPSARMNSTSDFSASIRVVRGKKMPLRLLRLLRLCVELLFAIRPLGNP
jgi:hypothetical protein